jgi:hypothetical protein
MDTIQEILNSMYWWIYLMILFIGKIRRNRNKILQLKILRKILNFKKTYLPNVEINC